jgi:hypothetical protein
VTIFLTIAFDGILIASDWQVIANKAMSAIKFVMSIFV